MGQLFLEPVAGGVPDRARFTLRAHSSLDGLPAERDTPCTMSREQVELVSVFYPGGDFDVVPRWCDDEAWLEWESVLAPRLHPDFEHVVHGDGVDAGRYLGAEGLRAALVDWYEPWAEYRIEVEEAIDLGDRVLVLSNAYGRMKGSEAEVRSVGAAVFTIRDGMIAAYEDYQDRAEALRAVTPEDWGVTR